MPDLPTPEQIILQLPELMDGLIRNNETSFEVMREMHGAISSLMKSNELLAKQVLELRKELNHFALPSAS